MSATAFLYIGIKCLIDLVEQVEGGRVTFLDCKDERHGNQGLLTSTQLVHLSLLLIYQHRGQDRQDSYGSLRGRHRGRGGSRSRSSLRRQVRGRRRHTAARGRPREKRRHQPQR